MPARAVTVLVTYGDGVNEGFNDPTLGAARRNALEAAASQWGQTLNGNVPVRINAFFDPQGGSSNSATLAFAGPESFFEDWTGTPQPNTFYAVPLANQLADTDLDPGFVDITATFNSDVDNSTVLGSIGFYYGTDLQAGSDIDFYTIALHELCHGLGFLDTVNTDGSYALTNPSIYDLHLANGSAAGATLISNQTPAQRAAALISASLFFSGTNTRAANSNANAKIYAPNPYESGSSVSHLDETTFSPPPDGTAPNANDELMTPFSSANTHNPGAVVTGIMKDLGWSFQNTALPTIAISDVSVTEGNSATTSATLTLTLSAASSSNVTVNYTTTDASAVAGSDYTTKSGTVTFTAGQTSRTVVISVTGDTNIESDETFFVDLSSSAGANLADNRGVVTIINDDSPTISINDVSVTEGNSGTTNATLTLTLSAASVSNVTVNYATASASAVAGSDFTAKIGTVTFTAGQTSRTVVISIIGDTNPEANETFFVDLSAPTGATLADNRGVVTIVDNDINGNAPVNLSLSPQASSNAPATARVFTTVHSDPNGNDDISQAMLQLNTNTSGVGALRCYYAATNNLLFFLNDAGTGFLGGFAPGSNNVISNARGSLDCSKTTVTRSGNNITIAWNVTPTAQLSGLRLNCFLFTRDKSNFIDNFEAFGNWLITGNVAPVNTSLSPTAITANLGVAQDLTTVYTDANGADSLSQLMLRVGTPFDDCLQAFYDQLGDKLYLLNDTATGYLGGFAPGTSAAITNQHGTLDCSNTTVTRNGNTLTIKWRIAVTHNPWAGTKQNVWMFARDRGNSLAPFAIKGSWAVGSNSAPINISITPDSIASPLNSQQTVGARYQDANGASNLAQAILRIGANPTTGLQTFYDVQANLLYLINDAGTGYIGGFAPGSNNIIANKRGKLHCLNTTINRAGNDLFVNWSITLTSATYVDTSQALFLFCRDRGNLLDNYEQFGTWQITGANAKQSVPAAQNNPLLSSIEVNLQAQTVTLNFAASLPDVANDANNFAVQVNGQKVQIVSAKRNGSSVALKLSANSIHQSDKVAVAWRNLPSSGEAVISAE